MKETAKPPSFFISHHFVISGKMIALGFLKRCRNQFKNYIRIYTCICPWNFGGQMGKPWHHFYHKLIFARAYHWATRFYFCSFRLYVAASFHHALEEQILPYVTITWAWLTGTVGSGRSHVGPSSSNRSCELNSNHMIQVQAICSLHIYYQCESDNTQDSQ